MTQMEKVMAPPPPLYGTSVANKVFSQVAMPEKFDVVIYNPPFTETRNQSQKFSKQTRAAMATRLQDIKATLQKRDPAAARAIAKRSIRPYFTPLTAGMVKSGGKLAKIIPATACTSENGRAERQYIANNFHVEIVVTSHDPKRVNFSESTSIHECLVIGTRGGNADNKPTRFIQLVAYPSNVSEVEALIDAIQKNSAGELYSETLWPAEKVQAGDWSPVQWFDKKLAGAADQISSISALRTTGDLYHWKIKNIPDFYLNFDYERSSEGNAFCTINETIIQTLQPQADTLATPKAGQEVRAAKVMKEADHILVAQHIRTTSTRIVALYSEQPAIGGAYRAVGIYDKELAKAYVSYLNSSFGILQLLNRRNKTLTYPQYENDAMRSLLLPDPNKANLTPLLDAFEQVKNTPLQRLALCAEDPARKILDHAAAKSIGADPAVTDQWRAWLSQEPTITNKPYTAAP